jgi:hypothetical protein
MGMTTTGMSMLRAKELQEKLEISLDLNVDLVAYGLTRCWIYGCRNWLWMS